MSAVLPPTYEGDFTFAQDAPLALSGGGALRPVTLRYALYGELNAARDNAILVCHALSGSARVADWWPELVGPGQVLDSTRYCVIGVNVLGSCYGSTGPSSVNPATGRLYGGSFPLISVGDMVRAQSQLLDSLHITRLHAVIGGSIGGMQALEWAVRFPARVARCAAIGAAPLPALGLALNHLQRQAIRLDPHWREGNYAPDEPPAQGLALARALAMCSYKSARLFDERHARQLNRRSDNSNSGYDIAGYLDYQGAIFNRRFDANSYLILSQAMDDFSLARDGQDEITILRHVTAPTLLIGISSDWLFPPQEVENLARQFRSAGVPVRHETIVSAHGHDAFLAEAEKITPLLAEFIGAETYAA